MTNMPSQSKLCLCHRITTEKIIVELQAHLLDERRFKLIYPASMSLETIDGIQYEEDSIKVLIGEGVRWARSRLQLDKGISVETYLLSGVVDFENETGLCIAVALSIVRQLGADLSLLELGGNDWQECT